MYLSTLQALLALGRIKVRQGDATGRVYLNRALEVTRLLFLAEKTVEHHVSSIFGKLGVTRRAEAIGKAHTVTTPLLQE